jgi:hypothetical protein
MVKVRGLTEQNKKLKQKHRTSIERAEVVEYNDRTGTYTAMPTNDTSGTMRPRIEVPARALERVCTTGDEELSSRGGVFELR